MYGNIRIERNSSRHGSRARDQLSAREYQTSDGVTINFVETGNPAGPPILFVHGISQSWRSWTKQLNDEALRKKYRLIALDLRGHGESQGAQGAIDTAGRSLRPLVKIKFALASSPLMVS